MKIFIDMQQKSTMQGVQKHFSPEMMNPGKCMPLYTSIKRGRITKLLFVDSTVYNGIWTHNLHYEHIRLNHTTKLHNITHIIQNYCL